MKKEIRKLPRAFCAPAELAHTSPDTAVLLAFSGGADSRALLHMLASLAEEQRFRLTLAHVEHGIRGEDSRRDLEFCRQIAEQYGLEIFTLSADVPALARKSGRSLEDEAREVRYEFFDRLMRERHIPLLATAHHADDQAETMLFRLCRGTGLGGLSGIAPVRAFSCGYLTRPLLGCSKGEILDYCAANRLDFVTDNTNFDTAYARNRLRAEVLPVMEELFAGVSQRMTATADALREDAQLLDAMARECLERARVADGVRVDALREAPAPICRRVLMQWLAGVLGKSPERVHVDAVMHLVFDGAKHARAALPCGKSAVIEQGCLRVLSACAEPVLIDGVPFCEGRTEFASPGISVSVQMLDSAPAEDFKPNGKTEINLPVDPANLQTLFWRSRRDGDVVLMHGMHKRLRRLLREADIPPRMRNAIPLLCDGEGIVWVPFVGLRDGVKTKTPTCRVSLELTEWLRDNGKNG